MLCHGPVRAPADARTGKAVVRVEFQEGAQFKSFATDLPVEIR